MFKKVCWNIFWLRPDDEKEVKNEGVSKKGKMVKKRGRRRNKIEFKHLYAYKILDELLLDHAKKYIFSLDYNCDVGFLLYKESYITRNFKFLYKIEKKNT